MARSASDTEAPLFSPRRQKRLERAPAAAFVVSMLSSVALAVVYWQGGQTQAEGILLAITLGGIGVGMVLWAKRFLPPGPVTEPRGRLASTDAEIAAFAADFGEGAEAIGRRRLLTRLLIGAFAALGVAALFPIRSLGPRPGRGLKQTPFRAGLRLVTEDGQPVVASEFAVDSVLTVWPEGHTDAADAPTLLIRLRPNRIQPDWVRPGYAAGENGEYVAYSKLCTHMSCPVGLYQAERGLLLCPCHQSTFNVYEQSRPIFGPAARPLPQLPISINADGQLQAEGDFSSPVGPGFWDRGR